MRIKIHRSNREDRLWLWDIHAGKEHQQSGHAETSDKAVEAANAWIGEQLRNNSHGPAGITEAQERMIGNRMARALRLRRVIDAGEARWSLGDQYRTRTDLGIFRILRGWSEDLVKNRCPEALMTEGEKRKAKP